MRPALPTPVVAPREAGLSPDRLARIDRFLSERYIGTGKLPCAEVAVWRGGGLAHHVRLGHQDPERGVPLAEDTVYRIYSMTKPVTSVALMQLVEQGRIALDEPVHRHIPDWRDLGVYAAGFMETFRTRGAERPMLVVDLLRHTSGLTYGFQQRTNVDAAYRKQLLGDVGGPVSLEEMVGKLARLPLEFSPGTAWNYSVSTDICGRLVEIVSGQSLPDYFDEHIFGPLGMSETGFFVREDQAQRFASCWWCPPGGKPVLQDDPRTSLFLKPPVFVSGGGGLVSTMTDYLTFCRMLLEGGSLGGAQILSPKTVELMTQNHLPGGRDLTDMSISLFSEATYAGVGFGLGFAIGLDPARSLVPGSVGDFWWGGAASTYFWIDPAEDLICVFLTQLLPSTTYNVRRELRTLVYSAFTE
ncbi:MAG: beta-lactamase family protein [Alphaproteobacteria bacterium]|nr:beta-lactamase family protein [Alphaproteobacteria bacterium]